METLRETLARRLRELMGAHLGMDTQVKVAAKSGVSQSTVQRILARDQAATVDLLEQLASAFGVRKPQYFLLNQDELDLLTAWAGLSSADKDRAMGFIHVTSQQGVGHNESLLSFKSSRDTAPEIKAAIARDAARPLVREGSANQKRSTEHAAPSPAKRRRS